MGDNLEHLTTELACMDESLRHIQTQFEDQQRQLSELVGGCLGRINDALKKLKALICHANEHRSGLCHDFFFFCNPKIPADIIEWKTKFDDLFQQLDSALSTAAHTAQIVVSAQPQEEMLRHPLPDSGFVGSGIQVAQQQLLSWLHDPQARVISVWGMVGVGKTALLQLIYNNYKKKVSTNFNFFIWHTICQNCKIESLQDTIAESLNLKFKPSSSIDMRKMELYASLENKRFLLALDDIWSPIDLNEVGVHFGGDKGSEVLISSHSREFVEIMATDHEYCMKRKPLSTDEGWDLFRRRAFRIGAAPDNNLEVIARKFVLECEGFSLAINTVAATMAQKKTAHEWIRALDLMRNVDPSSPYTHPTIEAELYKLLRYSYDDFPNNNLKMCFLYYVSFPEDATIRVDTLVEMWAA